MTYLALDVGTRRIGVAVGSTDLRLATPLAVIRRDRLETDAAQVRALAEQYDAERVVVGLPQELDGTIGVQAQRIMDYATRLQSLVARPFEFFDERYSTAQALAQRREMGVNEKRGRATIDAAAAAIILQDFFNAAGQG
ncbi:MAG: Holliday junction resolvase RuvX [Anaerolineae bacterium]